jgi:hypothetical protein
MINVPHMFTASVAGRVTMREPTLQPDAAASSEQAPLSVKLPGFTMAK